MNTKLYLLGSSPIDELLRLADYDVKHVWNISESRNFTEINFLPQQYCQLSKHIFSTLLPKIHDNSSKLLIMSHCSELNRFHSLVEEIEKHDFIEIPRSNRKHALSYLKKQLEDYIYNDSSLNSVSLELLNQEISDRRKLMETLKLAHMMKQLGYVDVLSLIPLILDREPNTFQSIVDEIKNKIDTYEQKDTKESDKPSILILGEFWCEEIIGILEEMEKLFDIKKDTFENGLGYLYQKTEEIHVENLETYINFVAVNTLKSNFNPSSLDFEVEEIMKEVKEMNIEGIIILNYKFCDVYTFLAPLIKQHPDIDIPILEIELENEGLGVEQIKTRLEALKECLLDRRE